MSAAVRKARSAAHSGNPRTTDQPAAKPRSVSRSTVPDQARGEFTTPSRVRRTCSLGTPRSQRHPRTGPPRQLADPNPAVPLAPTIRSAHLAHSATPVPDRRASSPIRTRRSRWHRRFARHTSLTAPPPYRTASPARRSAPGGPAGTDDSLGTPRSQRHPRTGPPRQLADPHPAVPPAPTIRSARLAHSATPVPDRLASSPIRTRRSRRHRRFARHTSLTAPPPYRTASPARRSAPGGPAGTDDSLGTPRSQ